MTKYDEAFKREVVQEYLSGGTGTRALSQKHGVEHSLVRRWILVWQCHGDAGLHKKQSVFSAGFKMRVLQHMWRHELSCRQVSALFDLREAGTVGRWARQYHEGGYEALTPRRKGRPT